MKLFKIEDLSYNGVKEGVHSWDILRASNPTIGIQIGYTLPKTLLGCTVDSR